MSDIFEVKSDDGSELKAFASFNKFTFAARDKWTPQLSVDLTPAQARELASKLLDFAEREEPTDRFAMGTPSVAHAGENKDSDS